VITIKKVGMITCYIDNYGACLQAYALMTSIQKLGHSCVIIRFQGAPGYPARNLKQLVKKIPGVQFFRKKILGATHVNHLRDKKFNLFRKTYLNFTKEVWYSGQEIVNMPPKDFDCYVCGSDQVWNPYIYQRNLHVAFLDFAPPGVFRISYAPSIGVPEYPAEYLDELKRLVNKMNFISVREKEGKDILKKVTNKDVRVVLDPTLLLNIDEWRKIAVMPKVNQPYIFCYVFGNNSLVIELIEYTREKTGFEVITVPYTEKMFESTYTKVEDAGPRDFLGLISNAELIITDSFHGLAFSLNFNKKFYATLRHSNNDKESMNSRIFNILRMTGTECRLVTDKEQFPQNPLSEIDIHEINKLLQEKRASDIMYLQYALENERM